MNLTSGFSSVHNLWAMGCAGLLHAHAGTPLPSGEKQEGMDDPAFIKTHIDEADSALHASVLILAYTVSSELVTDLCEISAACDPAAWAGLVRKKKVPLGNILDSSVSSVLQETLTDYIRELAYKSLEPKCATLLSVLGPVECKAVLPGYSWSQNRIRDLNTLRCSCVHGFRFKTTIPDLRAKVQYLCDTVRFFGKLVQTRHALATGQSELDEWP